MPVTALLRHCLLSLALIVGLSAITASVQAQTQQSAQSHTAQARSQLQQSTRQVQQIRKSLGDIESAETLRSLSEQALDVQRVAEQAVRELGPELERLDARIAQLGELAEGSSEGSAVANQRKSLGSQRNQVDELIKQGNLLSVEARQLSEAIEKERVQRLGQQLGLRVASPLSPMLWQKVIAQVPADLGRFDVLLRQQRQAMQKGIDKHGWALPLTALGVALVVFFPLRLWLRRLGRRVAASERAPKGRLRRTGLAVWLMLVGTILPGVSALAVVAALKAIDGIAPRFVQVADSVVSATFLAAFIAALSACLLVPTRPSWRLLPLDDQAAARLRKYAWMAAGLMWVTWVGRSINRAARTSEITGVALDGLLALGYIALIMAMLMSLTRLHRRQQQELAAQAVAGGNVSPAARRQGGWAVLVRVFGHLTVAAALLATLLGWINLAMFAAQQMIWLGVVGMALLLLLKFADDLAMRVFAADSPSGKAVMLATGLSGSRLEQVGVLASALLRLSLIFLALIAIALPQGNSTVVLGWFDTLRNGISIGDTVLRPWTLVRALLVLTVGLGVLQLLQRWLVDTYLPKTSMDAGGRNSISTVARYLGLAIVALWTLAALGLGFQKLALVVSALSVGIGFGLQAITQNFFSGLILLAERPVKIGDLVRIGDLEGDVRRISVRATEIQAGDKSTLIVPNSELITKTIRNMTLSNPTGRVQIKFQVPLSTDVAQLREVLLGVYAAHPGVQEEPAPTFYVDAIDGGMITVNSFGHVGSPRNVYSIKSDLLFELLVALQAAGIALSTPTDVHLLKDAE
jgi:potassium-dependent mechanosensitive channel